MGAVRKATAALRRDPRVAGVSTAEQPGARVLLTVASAHEPQHPETQALVEDLRHGQLAAELAPLDALVGGETAAAIDIRATSFSGLLTVLAVLLPLVLLLFTFVLRSLLLPLKAVLLVCLSLTAALGSLVLLTDTSTGAGLVGQAIPIGIHPIVPIVVAAIAIALTTDYEVILIGRIREQFELHRDNTRAIREGLAQTGPVITAAGVIMLVVFGTFASADVFPIKQMGIGLGMVVLLDVTVVRGVLVPATMVLLGRGNWWLPARSTTRLAAAAVLSWVGLLIHNVGALGDESILQIDTLGPTAIFLTIAALSASGKREFALTMLRNWAWLHLVVGVVLTGLLDSAPEHLAWHALYGLLQIPLIVLVQRRRAASRMPEWRGPESNRRHHDFQSCALPTELPRQARGW